MQLNYSKNKEAFDEQLGKRKKGKDSASDSGKQRVASDAHSMPKGAVKYQKLQNERGSVEAGKGEKPFRLIDFSVFKPAEVHHSGYWDDMNYDSHHRPDSTFLHRPSRSSVQDQNSLCIGARSGSRQIFE